MSRVVAARDAAVAKAGRKVPLFLKIAPDLDEADLDDIAAEVLEQAIDGVIVSNTTLSRAGLDGSGACERNRRPVRQAAVRALDHRAGARCASCSGPNCAIIGVGGVDSAETALEKIRAGADLVQLYTGMIYGGPGAARPRSCAAWSDFADTRRVSQHRATCATAASITGPDKPID